MSSKLPESTRLAYARQLADEAKTLVPGMERLSAIAEELRADDLYRLLGFDTWERFCTDYLGVSKRTANRWIAGQKPKSIGAGQSVAAGQNVPVVESDTLKSDKSPEGLDQSGLHRAGQRADEPSGTVSVNDPPTPSGPSSGGARTTAPPVAPTGEAPTSPSPAPLDPPEYPVPGYPVPGYVVLPTDRPPSDRQLAARVFAAMREIEPTDAGPVTTPEEATFLRQWAQRTLDAWKAVYAPPAPAEKPQRRQGTISRPSDRAPKPPVKVNGSPVAGSLTRRTVTPMFKP